MNAKTLQGQDPRIDEAIAELRQLIEARYPEAVFAVAPGEDPEGVYLTVTVDVDDTDEVFGVVVERLLQMQVEDRLPVYVLPVRPIERVVAELHQRAASWSRLPLPTG